MISFTVGKSHTNVLFVKNPLYADLSERDMILFITKQKSCTTDPFVKNILCHHPNWRLFESQGRKAAQLFCLSKKSLVSSYDVKRRDFIHREEKLHTYSVCEWTFKTSVYVKTLENIHEDVKSRLLSLSEMLDMKNDEIFHRGEKLLKCSFYNKAFTSAYCLKKHEMIHVGENPIKCSIWDKELSTLHSLVGFEDRKAEQEEGKAKIWSDKSNC